MVILVRDYDLTIKYYTVIALGCLSFKYQTI